MEASAIWFVVLAGTTALGALLGVRLGRGQAWQARVGLIVGLIGLSGWTWLMWHPSVAVQLLPLTLLSYLEGIGSVPAFMLIIGIAWATARAARQRRLALLAGVVGVIFFFHGSMWMLQPTPAVGLADTPRAGLHPQSEDYSCGPAAAVNALNLLGVPTSEHEMARLSYTRAGTGTTTLRTMLGLARRLESTPFRVDLVEPTYDQLVDLPMPALTPLQFEPTRRHMVTLLEVDERSVLFVDPVDGVLLMMRSKFEELYTGQVIIFIQDQPRLASRHAASVR